jgi:hypothetical protein
MEDRYKINYRPVGRRRPGRLSNSWRDTVARPKQFIGLTSCKDEQSNIQELEYVSVTLPFSVKVKMIMKPIYRDVYLC